MDFFFAGFPRIFTIFAKNTAHNERRLRKNAYLCTRNKLIGYEVR